MVIQEKFKKLIWIFQTSNFFKVLLLHGVAAGVEHSSVLKSLRSEKIQTFIDIGANRGQFALIAHEQFPEAKIVSFEPLRDPASVFRRVFALVPGIVLHEIAISPREENKIIHISSSDDSSSLLPISNLQNKLFPGTAEKTTCVIQAKPLDAIIGAKEISSCSFLKMDVQGYELEALVGCKSLLPLFEYLYIECSFVELYIGQALAHEVISYLFQFDFVLTGVYNLHYDKKGIAIQADFLFARRD
ncbi:MAG: FkbM family methyltransferase [Chloroflexi bacterium]|nr:FkbM family methyltransferase [Chloroflexota bacterium]